jgi:hypothetical protein
MAHLQGKDQYAMRYSLVVILTWILAGAASAREFTVRDAKAIRTAMHAAQAGDTISIQPGDYDMGDALVAGNSGSKDQPITMRTSGETGYARLTISGRSDVGFRVLGRFWILRGLHIEGNRSATLDLIQIDATRGGGDLAMIDCRVSRCREFLLKASRSREKGADNVVLEHCEWFDCSETAIDLVAGDHWIIRGNYVHDYGKDGAAHYGIFLKGGGKNGLIEGNLVNGRGGKRQGRKGHRRHQLRRRIDRWEVAAAGRRREVCPRAPGRHLPQQHCDRYGRLRLPYQ